VIADANNIRPSRTGIVTTVAGNWTAAQVPLLDGGTASSGFLNCDSGNNRVGLVEAFG
jgi:hypothetical protein